MALYKVFHRRTLNSYTKITQLASLDSLSAANEAVRAYTANLSWTIYRDEHLIINWHETQLQTRTGDTELYMTAFDSEYEDSVVKVWVEQDPSSGTGTAEDEPAASTVLPILEDDEDDRQSEYTLIPDDDGGNSESGITLVEAEPEPEEDEDEDDADILAELNVCILPSLPASLYPKLSRSWFSFTDKYQQVDSLWEYTGPPWDGNRGSSRDYSMIPERRETMQDLRDAMEMFEAGIGMGMGRLHPTMY